MAEESYREARFDGFGYREIAMAAELLAAYAKNPGDASELDHATVRVGFNLNSGYVFLTDENCEVYVEGEDGLSRFVTCPECGNEGTEDEVSITEFETNSIFGWTSACQNCRKELEVMEEEKT